MTSQDFKIGNLYALNLEVPSWALVSAELNNWDIIKKCHHGEPFVLLDVVSSIDTFKGKPIFRLTVMLKDGTKGILNNLYIEEILEFNLNTISILNKQKKTRGKK